MTLATFIKTLAEEMAADNHMSIANDLRMLNRFLENGYPDAAKHYIKQYLVDDARPLVRPLYNAIYRTLEGDKA